MSAAMIPGRRWAMRAREAFPPGSPRRALAARVALAGPGAIVATLLVVLGMALWIPQGPAGIDQIALPLLLLPLVWAALFFQVCLDRSLKRVALVIVALSLAHAAAIAWHVAAAHRPASTEDVP